MMHRTEHGTVNNSCPFLAWFLERRRDGVQFSSIRLSVRRLAIDNVVRARYTACFRDVYAKVNRACLSLFLFLARALSSNVVAWEMVVREERS